jgi:hypothetical protein
MGCEGWGPMGCGHHGTYPQACASRYEDFGGSASPNREAARGHWCGVACRQGAVVRGVVVVVRQRRRRQQGRCLCWCWQRSPQLWRRR